MAEAEFGGLCEKGHDVPAGARFCPSCGAPAYGPSIPKADDEPPVSSPPSGSPTAPPGPSGSHVGPGGPAAGGRPGYPTGPVSRQGPPGYGGSTATPPPSGYGYPAPGSPASGYGYPASGPPPSGYGYPASGPPPPGWYGPAPQGPPALPSYWSYGPRSQGTNGLAIASMVLAILWIWWIGSILAVIFGHVALRQIRSSSESGRGMAIVGLVLGYIGLAVGLVVAIAASVHG